MEWWRQRSALGLIAFQFGNSTDKPLQGDYTGDGKADAAVFRASGKNWYLQRSTAVFMAVQFGLATDKPVPTAFIPSN